jgi:hypothetical protein
MVMSQYSMSASIVEAEVYVAAVTALLLLLGTGTWSSGLPANANVSGVQCQACPAGQTSDTGATSPSHCCECYLWQHSLCLLQPANCACSFCMMWLDASSVSSSSRRW